MGSSPAKVDFAINKSKKDSPNPYGDSDDGLVGGSDGSTIGEGTKYQRLLNENTALQNAKDAKTAQDLAEKNAKKIDKNSKKIKPTKAEEETAARKSRTESMNSMPWNKDVKEKLADKTKTATSKREQRANYKAAKENARKDDGKISKKERQDINRERDITRSNTAAANGDQALSFNWKNAILGGQGLQAGFDIDSKSKKIDAKMAKQDTDRASKKAAGATNNKRKSDAYARREKTAIGRKKNRLLDKVKETVQSVKNIGKKKKVKENTTPTTNTTTTNTPTVTSTVIPTVAPTTTSTTSTTKKTTVKKKQNQNEGNDPKNEITTKPNKVSKTYDGSKTTTPPTEVKEEVKIADAKKPKYVPSIKNEKLKGNLVVNQELMNKKVPKKEKPVATVENKTTPKPVVKKSTNEKVSLNSKTSGPRAVVKKKVKEVLVKSNKVDYANSLLKK